LETWCASVVIGSFFGTSHINMKKNAKWEKNEWKIWI
jgi:hypothetical protein